MQACVPSPQPDQTLESLLALSELRSSHGYRQSFLSKTFRELQKTRSFIPLGFAFRYLQVGHQWHRSMEELLDNHGYIGLLKPFDPTAYDDFLTLSVVPRHARPSNLRGPGFMAGCRRIVRQHVHFCRSCVEHELGSIGYAYAHRTHQIRGVYRCHLHGDPLQPSSDATRLPLANNGILFRQQRILEAAAPDPLEAPRDHHVFARFVAGTLDGRIPRVSSTTLQRLLHRRLAHADPVPSPYGRRALSEHQDRDLQHQLLQRFVRHRMPDFVAARVGPKSADWLADALDRLPVIKRWEACILLLSACYEEPWHFVQHILAVQNEVSSPAPDQTGDAAEVHSLSASHALAANA